MFSCCFLFFSSVNQQYIYQKNSFSGHNSLSSASCFLLAQMPKPSNILVLTTSCQPIKQESNSRNHFVEVLIILFKLRLISLFIIFEFIISKQFIIFMGQLYFSIPRTLPLVFYLYLSASFFTSEMFISPSSFNTKGTKYPVFTPEPFS